MSYKILTLSPGSTSTKVAVFDGTEALFRLNVTHPSEELAKYDMAADQFEYRKGTILSALEGNGVRLADIDAFSGYCGAMGPTVGGIFAIDRKVCDHVLDAGVNHPAILGAPLLYAFAREVGRPTPSTSPTPTSSATWRASPAGRAFTVRATSTASTRRSAPSAAPPSWAWATRTATSSSRT